ncbi:MAG TPA: mechanosensitive ion channel family protein [Candidatus Eisenbacteria bacterium]|jgi:small conductance mechanosensitive channel
MIHPAFLLLTRMLPEPDRLADIGIRLALTIVAAFLLQRLLYLVVGRIEKVVIRAGRGAHEVESRARTLGQILRSLITVVVVAGAVIHGLAVLGWNVAPLLAGAGIVGVALGFGAQTLVRDVIAGLFILGENQFSVGDVIEIDGKPAVVEALRLRASTLRDFNGYVHYVPNGELKTVTNRSRGWTRVAVDVPVASDQSLEKALEICRRVVNAMNADPAWVPRLLDAVELWGVESLTREEAQIRIVIRARPGDDAPEAARSLRLATHRALTDAGIRSALSRDIVITPIAGGPGAAEPALAGEARGAAGGRAAGRG